MFECILTALGGSPHDAKTLVGTDDLTGLLVGCTAHKVLHLGRLQFKVTR